ncbi:hypothetical protein IFR05_015959 [Cadophora sp. M221]|nr:hypothetical protein IFR05_015959 [Cadophora sp. M221]
MDLAPCQVSNGAPVTPIFKLDRLARIVQDIFYQFRKKTFGAGIKKIEYRDGIMFTHETVAKDFLSIAELLGLCASYNDEKTLLVRYGCTEAVALMGDMLMYGLGLDESSQPENNSEGESSFAEMNCHVVVSTVEVKEPDRKFVRITAVGERDRDPPLHEFFKVTFLVDGVKQSYALDLSCAQYGYYNPLVAYNDYLKDRVAVLKLAQTLGRVKQKYNRYSKSPLLERANFWAKEILSNIWQWEIQEGIRLMDVIGLPEGEYEEKRLKLLNRVAECLEPRRA